MAVRAPHRHRVAVAGVVALGVGLIGSIVTSIPARGATIPVPNGSFESPATPFVTVLVEGWQKSPKPDWYEETGGFQWDQLTGIFKNPVAGSTDHIENCEGTQAGWLFAVPEVGLFQDFDASPAPALDVRFEVATSYQLTVGVIGMGGNMLEGVPLEIRLYYRDDAGRPVNVAATTVTNQVAVFGTRGRFVDFSLRLPEVQRSDAWAGRHIGIGFRSMVSFEMQGGFWDLDHVRLDSFGPPVIQAPAWKDGQFEATIVSEPGMAVDILAAEALQPSAEAWMQVARLTNVIGTVRFTDPSAGDTGRFYQVRLVP